MKPKIVVSANLAFAVFSSIAVAQDGDPVVAPSIEEAQTQVQQAVVEAEPTPKPVEVSPQPPVALSRNCRLMNWPP